MTSEAAPAEVEDVQDASTHLGEVVARDQPTVLEDAGREVGVVFPKRLLRRWLLSGRRDDVKLLTFCTFCTFGDEVSVWVAKERSGSGLVKALADFGDDPAEAVQRLLAENADMKRRLALRAEAEAARNDPEDRAEIEQIRREFDEIDAW